MNFLKSIDAETCDSQLDSMFAILECYMKNLTMYNYYMEEDINNANSGVPSSPQTTSNIPTQSSTDSQSAIVPPMPQAGGGANPPQQQSDATPGGQQIPNGAIAQVCQKILETLNNYIQQFVQQAMSQAQMQQAQQQEAQIDQLVEQGTQSGQINTQNPEQVDQLVEQICQPDAEDSTENTTPEEQEREKKLVKSVLVGDFKDAYVLSPQNIQALQQSSEVLDKLVAMTKEKGKDPNALCEAIANQLNDNINGALSNIGGETRANVMAGDTSAQMSKQAFRDAEKTALKLLGQMSAKLNTIDQMFKQGGFWNAIGNAFNKDIRAKTVSTQAFQKLQNILSTVRKNIAVVTSDIQAVRKTNKKMIRKLNTIIVGGNNSVQAYANRKGVQNAGITTQSVERRGQVYDVNGSQALQNYRQGQLQPTV